MFSLKNCFVAMLCLWLACCSFALLRPHGSMFPEGKATAAAPPTVERAPSAGSAAPTLAFRSDVDQLRAEFEQLKAYCQTNCCQCKSVMRTGILPAVGQRFNCNSQQCVPVEQTQPQHFQQPMQSVTYASGGSCGPGGCSSGGPVRRVVGFFRR